LSVNQRENQKRAITKQEMAKALFGIQNFVKKKLGIGFYMDFFKEKVQVRTST
jgi:hypothetical protein